MERIFSYNPICAPDARTLILGSAPSVLSLRDGFYYAHPQNAFWRIIADAYGQPRPATIQQKTALILNRRLALWDVIHSCERAGSLDANIKNAEPNDIPSLLAQCPRIDRVLLNGTTACALYRRHFASLGLEAIKMPSTSPAYTLPYARKLAAWREALTGDTP